MTIELLGAAKTHTNKKAQELELRVAELNKELKDYQRTLAQVNANQEAKQSVTGYGIVSLPKNCANGKASAIVKGETRENKINGEITDVCKSIIGLTPDSNTCISVENVINATTWRYLIKCYKNGVDVTANVVPPAGFYFTGTSIYNNVNGTMKNFVIKGDFDRLDTKVDAGDVTPSTTSTKAMVEQGVTERKSYISYGTKSTASTCRLQIVGKSLFEYPKGVYTGNGINVVSENGEITINGTATTTFRLNVLRDLKFVASSKESINLGHKVEFNGQPHTISHETSGVMDGIAYFSMVDNSLNTLDRINGNDKVPETYTIIGDKDCYGMYILFLSEANFNNFKLKTQLEKGSI